MTATGIPLFQRGDFTLHSGATSDWKIECDALGDEDWATLALMLVEVVGPFGDVMGVPQGGLALETALKPYRTPSEVRLIVDDVLTTGGSMEEMRAPYRSDAPIRGAVIFARGPCPGWITPLFQMPVTDG